MHTIENSFATPPEGRGQHNGGLREAILSTLLYYDIFAYPLTESELDVLLHREARGVLTDALHTAVRTGEVYTDGAYYGMTRDIEANVRRRHSMERYARRHWIAARIMTHVIKRCPFVRAVMITGTLSKNLSAPALDIDYFIVTDPGRLWIARSFLTVFKKLFLFNSRKYFCLNYFVATDALAIPDRNVFTATEIAHVKVLHGAEWYRTFVAANAWLGHFLPRWSAENMPQVPSNDRRSILARLAELPFLGDAGARLDLRLMRGWAKMWKRRYPELSDEKRNTLFRVDRSVSRAHGPDFQTRILSAYEERCARHSVSAAAPLSEESVVFAADHTRPTSAPELRHSGIQDAGFDPYVLPLGSA
ncbi:MAG: hypothetical protein HY962_17865 [Ignavibacteriae bacterium]|nr:hypothetical protein [Ignavibacteriota bacterium]